MRLLGTALLSAVGEALALEWGPAVLADVCAQHLCQCASTLLSDITGCPVGTGLGHPSPAAPVPREGAQGQPGWGLSSLLQWKVPVQGKCGGTRSPSRSLSMTKEDKNQGPSGTMKQVCPKSVLGKCSCVSECWASCPCLIEGA